MSEKKAASFLRQLQAAGAEIGDFKGNKSLRQLRMSSRLADGTLKDIQKLKTDGGGFTAWGNWPLRIEAIG